MIFIIEGHFFPVSMIVGYRKRGRVVDCTGLENRQRATVREFESHRFRQLPVHTNPYQSMKPNKQAVLHENEFHIHP